MTTQPPRLLLTFPATAAASPPRAERHGAPLRACDERGQPLTFLLERAARLHPQRGCLQLQPDGSALRLNYGELLRDAERIVGGLRQAGLQPGDPVLFQLESGLDYFPAFWACLLGGFVPVPASLPPSYDQPHAALTKLHNAWVLLGRPVILAPCERVAALQAYGIRQGLDGWAAFALDTLRRGSPDPRRLPTTPAQTAVLLLTSGSTGQPKAVALTHANLVAHVVGNIQRNRLSADDVSLNWMPLDHVGALVMFHLRDVALGAEQIHVLPEVILANPLNWLAWMHRYRVASTWAPNFAFALINDLADTFEHESWDLSRLRLIINGGEAVVSRTGRRFLSLLNRHGLPAGALHPAWGMSETSSGTAFSSAFRLDTTSDTDAFISVGEPSPGIAMRIVDSQGAVVAEGVVGALEVSGPVITTGYFKNQQANAAAFTADGWFKTGDLALLRAGQLTIAGREKDLIIINGVNFHGHEIEAVIEQIKGIEVSFTAACAVRVAGHDTDQLAVFYSAAATATAAATMTASGTDLPALGRQIRQRVLKEIGVNIDHVIALPKERIPKTAIGKIQRTVLKQQFEAGAFAAPVTTTTANPALAGCFRREWRAEALATHAGPASAAAGAGAPAAAGAGRIWVIVNDTNGLDERLRSELHARGEPVLDVECGAVPGDYDRVLTQVDAAAGQARPRIPHLIDLGSFADPTAPASLTAGADRLLVLAAALARWSGGEKPARLLVVSAGAQAVIPSEPVVAAHGALLGLLATLPQEIAGLEAAHLDLPFPAGAEAAQTVLAEATAPILRGELAWRAGRRYRSGLAALTDGEPAENPVAVTTTAPTTAPGAKRKPGGIYLVTGGLGGVGRELTENLLQRWQARVVVLSGREAVAEFSPEKLAALAALQRLGTVVYEESDVAELAAMRTVWQRTEVRWGSPPDGVFHLAGSYHECGLAEETAAGLRGALQAKARGAEVLGQLVAAHPDTPVVLFSSLLGYFGGFQTGAYAAANHFLENFTWQQRHRGHANFRCLLWSSWADRGMSRGLGDNVALRAKGFLALSPAQGWDALVAALESTVPVVLIGLDPRNPQVSAHLSAEATAWIAATDAAAAQISTDRAATRVEPRDEVERKLVTIWKTLLKVPAVGVRDSFFELGGRSLLAARLFAKINQEFGQNLPLATLFTFSTIEQLATLLKGAPPATSPGPRVIALQAKGNQPPLFGIPGRDANNLMYRDLVRPLGPDQPIYSLQTDDPADTETRARPLAIEACAARLIEQIRATRPIGPYLLSGHNFGAVLAWEVARRLGPEVRQLVLLAPPPAAFFNPLGAPEGTSESRSVVFTSLRQQRGFRRLFGQRFGAGGPAISREWREGRTRYGELTLHPTPLPVTVFGEAANTQPWRELAPAGFSLHREAKLGEILPTLLARAAGSPPPALTKKAIANRTSCLLPIRQHGDAHPFFCIPGSGSDAIVFQDIATALGDNHPVYGLQARGLDARPVEGAAPSVEEVAADFIQAIRSVQPAGPYHLGGHCFGCLLAWEVAGQLRAQGEEVGVLALLDPIVSNVFSDEILGLDRLGYHLRKFHRLSMGDKLRYFAAKVRNFSRTLIVRRRIGRSYTLARTMHARYTLKSYDLPVVVFLARDSFFRVAPERDPRRHYEKLCPRGVRYHEAEGDHHAILHPPGVAQVAAGLRAEISDRN